MKHLKDFPSPSISSILGHVKEFKAPEKHITLENWCEEFDNMYSIRLGVKIILVSGDLSFNDFVLKNRPNSFRRMKKLGDVMNDMTIKGVFTTEGDQWKQHRKITSEALNHKNSKAYFPLIKKHLNRLTQTLEANQSQEIDITQYIQKLTIDVTTEIAFGYDGNTQKNQDDLLQKSLSHIFPTINKRIGSAIPLWKIIKTKDVKLFEAAISYVRDHIDTVVQQAKTDINTSKKPENFLEALIIESQNDTLTDQELFGNVFTMLLAGEDTTSNAISWALFFLAQHKEVQEKAIAEFEKLDKPFNEFTTHDLDKCKYIEAIALETLRLKPVAPTLLFEALEETKFNDILLQKGDAVLLQNKVPQTDENNFSYADKFRPGRWINKPNNHNEQAFKPFGGGARFCPGKTLALDEMKSAVIILLQNFHFELAVPPNEVKEVAAFAMQPENLKMRFKALNR